MLTESGFKRRRYEDILPLIEQQARELFGSDIDLDEDGPMGQFIRLVAMGRAEENELAEDVWNSFRADKATGVSLDGVVKPFTTRKQRSKAIGEDVELILSSRATIYTGTIVGTSNNIRFATTRDITAVNAGVYKVDVEALEYGLVGNVPVGAINTIYTPTSGLQAVHNPKPTTGGRERETDTELRERYFDDGLSVRGSSTTPSIRSALLEKVEGVRAATVIENDTSETNAEGMPGHSIKVIVLGGDEKEIAQKIFEMKAGGIRAYGSTVIEITDEQNEVHEIGFDYSTEKDIYVYLELKTNINFPIEGLNMVKLEVIKYIGGSDTEGNLYKGLSNGQTVIQGRIENAVFKIDGVEDVTATISTDNINFSSDNIPVNKNEVAQTTFDKVVITNV